jgi:hypothetical protein
MKLKFPNFGLNVAKSNFFLTMPLYKQIPSALDAAMKVVEIQ